MDNQALQHLFDDCYYMGMSRLPQVIPEEYIAMQVFEYLISQPKGLSTEKYLIGWEKKMNTFLGSA